MGDDEDYSVPVGPVQSVSFLCWVPQREDEKRRRERGEVGEEGTERGRGRPGWELS